METKEFRVTVPDGYEIDEKNSTSECIKFKPKRLTYIDVVRELFKNGYYYSQCGIIKHSNEQVAGIYSPIDSTSKKQLEKLFAINKLMNVAKYLNGDWKTNWEDEHEKKWYMRMKLSTKELDIEYILRISDTIVYFKTKELAQQAIDILGEDAIRLALSTDW